MTLTYSGNTVTRSGIQTSYTILKEYNGYTIDTINEWAWSPHTTKYTIYIPNSIIIFENSCFELIL